MGTPRRRRPWERDGGAGPPTSGGAAAGPRGDHDVEPAERLSCGVNEARSHARAVRQSLEDCTAAEIDLTYSINTRATLLLAQAFAEQFDATEGGRVVFFTSGQYHGVMPAELPYIASKAALRELTPTLAAHLIGRAITVNCVNPGPNNTGHGDADGWAWISARNPGGRASRPHDTARLVGWSVSNEADWVTGQVIASDGGWSSLGA